jgi:MFS family permease
MSQRTSIFKFTWYNFLLVLFVSLGGLTYGFGFGVFVSSIGQPGFYSYFKLDRKSYHIIHLASPQLTPNVATTSHTASILGAVNALFSFGAAMGALAQSWISDKYGRKKAILVAIVLCVIGGALTAGSVHIDMLIVVRLLSGFGLGMIVTMSPMYIAGESTPSLFCGNIFI